MMKKQPLSFITGYLFEKMERHILASIAQDASLMLDSVCVPKIWFGLECSRDERVDIDEGIKTVLATMLEQVLSDALPSCNTNVRMIAPYNQYIRFEYTSSKKIEPRQMTVAEIEAALGYKIEIVS